MVYEDDTSVVVVSFSLYVRQKWRRVIFCCLRLFSSRETTTPSLRTLATARFVPQDLHLPEFHLRLHTHYKSIRSSSLIKVSPSGRFYTSILLSSTKFPRIHPVSPHKFFLLSSSTPNFPSNPRQPTRVLLYQTFSFSNFSLELVCLLQSFEKDRRNMENSYVFERLSSPSANITLSKLTTSCCDFSKGLILNSFLTPRTRSQLTLLLFQSLLVVIDFGEE